MPTFGSGITIGAGLTFTAPPQYLLSITPSGQSSYTWDMQQDGPLTLSTANTYDIVPGSNITMTTKMWGAGGNDDNAGAGGASVGTISFVAGTTYKFVVGSKILGAASSSPSKAASGQYSGIFTTSILQANALIMAGGGGGVGYSVGWADSAGGAGGGLAGGGGAGGGAGGGGGTQSAGGARGVFVDFNCYGNQGQALLGGNPFFCGDWGGAGGGGYWGGGSAAGVNNYPGGGGGGSGYIHPSLVSNGTLYGGSGTTPGLVADPLRGNSGSPLYDGKIYLTL